MGNKKSHTTIWGRGNPEAKFPICQITDLTETSSQTFSDIREKALQVEQIYLEKKISIPARCYLRRIIDEVKNATVSSIPEEVENGQGLSLITASNMNRISDAVLPLNNETDGLGCLADLGSGNLDLLNRERSKAKDTLWELEMFALLKDSGFLTVMEEPPDIVVEFEDLRLGIACKKFYSERHVQDVLSRGVKQIETNFDFGIVAVNIDDLLPKNKILRKPTIEAAGNEIKQFNENFIVRHERHFQKYLSSGRLISAIVSTTTLAETYKERVKLQNLNEINVWSVKGLPPKKSTVLDKFYHRLMG